MYLKHSFLKFILLVALIAFTGCSRASAQVLPLDQKNNLSTEWLVYEEGGQQLVPFIENVHKKTNAIHQWVSVTPSQEFLIGFVAQRDLSVFLNNRLVFKADTVGSYQLELAELAKKVKPVDGRYLLTVWHPTQQPNVKAFQNIIKQNIKYAEADHRPFTVKVREYVNQNTFILFLLLIGLIYGWLRVSYTADFYSLINTNLLDRTDRLDEGFLSKPISSWSSVLFILAFSLSLALLIAALHTNVQHIKLFNRLLPVSEADITTKVVFYTVVVFLFILLKYLFLKVMAFIFGLDDLVQLQYKEFVRTILFLGIFLPVVMLLYLSVNAIIPEVIVLVSNILVSLLLILTVVRVFVAVNKKAAVLNLHLFSYLCTTEVIPLAIVMKLIVFSF